MEPSVFNLKIIDKLKGSII